MDAKRAPVNLGLLRVKFCSHGNQTIVLWQSKPYLSNNGSHSWSHYFTTVTMVGDVTMETEVRNVGDLVLPRTYCLSFQTNKCIVYYSVA
jgi:hypothetical protein